MKDLPSVNRLAIVPIPLLMLAMVALWVADVRVVWTLPPLNLLVHYSPVALGVAFIVIPAARGFLADGQASVLMLGCGILMMDVGVTAMPAAFARSSDTAFAIYNTSALLGALCHLSGVVMTFRRKIRLRRSATWLTVFYAGGTAVMGLVIWAAFAGWMPVFFIDGQGGTLLRSLVVSTAVTLFVLTAGLLWQTNRRTASPFLHWYALGLVLLAAGLAGSLVIAVRDSPLQWVARFTQVLGTVYMCVAVLASAREGSAKIIPLAAVEEAWRENAFLASLRQRTPLGWAARYGLAVVAVAAAMGLRLALEAWVGPGLPTYITFYPAVMVAALLAGFGPGLVVTVLAGLTTAYWILPPEGFAVDSPVNRLGLVFFSGMGLFMSVVAELYRRNRDKAAAYDREVTLRESREILRRHAELIDPVRAKIIAREMQRVVRERGVESAAPAEPTGETLRRVPAVVGAAVAGLGLLVLIGWALGLDALKSVLPGLATMKANTALCFLLAGAALAFRERRAVRLACAGLVGAVAGLTLVEYLTGGNFGLDELLFDDTRDPHTIYPGRMVEATALGFLLIAASLLLLKARAHAALWAQQAMAVGAAIIGTVAVLGYAYDVQQLYRFAGYSSMALHTATSLVLLAVGLLVARSDGLGTVLTSPGSGAQLAWRLLAPVLLVPCVLGWLVVQGLRQNVFGEGMDIALLVLAMTFSLAALVLWAGGGLSRADAARRETETQLRNQAEVMDQASEALIVREMDGVIRSWNRGAERLYGWSAADAVGRSVHTLLHTPASALQEFETALEQTGHWEGELLHTTRDGRRVTVESRKTATRTDNGHVLVLESNRDITARKQAQETLAAAKARLQATLNSMAEGYYALDHDWRVVAVNAVAENHLGKPAAELIGSTFEQATEGRIPDNVREGIRQVMASGQPQHCEAKSKARPGTWAIDYIYPLDGGAEVYFTDITERKRAEEAVRLSEERWNAAIENFGEGAIIATEAEQVIYWNPAARRLHGFTSETEGIGPLKDTPMTFELRTPDGQHLLALDEWPMRRIKRGETVRNLELRLRRPEQGWERIVAYSGAMVEMAGGERLIFLSVCDLTEQRKAEEALRASLHEKEVLLKEIHHRVKNNMQVISSLVALQAERVPDSGMRAALQDVAHRVRSMALVHEKLYQSADMARVEFAQYAESLLNYLWRAHGTTASGIRLALDLEPVPLSVNAAVPCGLILNELVSNALKHAFRDRGDGHRSAAVVDGEVAVSLRRDPEDRVCLRVRDNGVGLPAGFDWRQADSLGLRLVQMLAGQLHATVEVCNHEGTEFTVVFGGPKTLETEST